MSTAQDLPAGIAEAAASVPLHLAPVPSPGEELDFTAFVRRYETRLRRLVQRRLGDFSEAEEITQETLLRAYQHRASFRVEDELIAWSTVVAQRLVIDRVRVRGRSITVADVPETARLGRDTADIVVARNEARTALDALEAIPDRQAAILWAREVEGLHYDEIADRFGITEPAVRSLLHRGRRALRKEYAARGGTLPMAGLAPLAPWLIWLRSAGKVRNVAKALGKTGAPIMTASLALAGITALGVASGNGPAGPAPREVQLPRSSAAQSASQSDTVAAPVATRLARPTDIPGPPSPTLTERIHVPWTCAAQTCVGNNQPSGETLNLGPQLPDNETGIGQLKFSQDYVPVCSALPTSPAATCTGDNKTVKNPLLGSTPDQGVSR